MRVLIVGGGNVCLEKLHFLLKSSPFSDITIVAPEIRKEVLELLDSFENARVQFIMREFRPEDVLGHQIIIAATSFRDVNVQVRESAKKYNILVNVADMPDLCDFYMGSIVTKGQVKLGISTNGKSPTLAKRLRELLEEALPDEIDDLSHNLRKYRELISDFEFEEKVKQLNLLTEKLIS